RHRGQQGQGLRRRDEAPRLRRPARLARCAPRAPQARLGRPVRHPRPRVQGQPHGGPHGRRARDHPQPRGRPRGRRPAGRARARRRARPSRRARDRPRPGQGRRRPRRCSLMPLITLHTSTVEAKGTVELPDSHSGVEPNVPVMHQVVTAQLAARRAGTQSTKTRAEVSGGGAKPWKQKGTGRARAGSIRAPQWRGGGVALGPKPRKYDQRTPKKMKRLALASALSDRAAEGKVVVVSEWSFAEPSTKAAKAVLEALGVTGRALIVLDPNDVNAAKSFRNLPKVHLLTPGELNTYDVLVSDYVLFTVQTLPGAVDAAPEPTTEAAS